MASTRPVSARSSRRLGLSGFTGATAPRENTTSAWTKAERLVERAADIEQLVAERLRPVALPGLRIMLGLLFIWFGGLKVAGASPVKAMVAGTLPWFDPNIVVPALGGVEVLLGLGLVTGVGLRLVVPTLVAHLAGTFLTFVMLPTQMFRHYDPLLLTEGGEFVTKNLVLIGATLVLFVHLQRPASADVPAPRVAADQEQPA